MSDLKWIKITTDIFDDEKILLIENLPDGDSLIVIWFKLLCLAGKQNNDGIFIMNNRIPYTIEMLATIFRRNKNVVTLALGIFEEYGMIEVVDGTITIPNWEKHQNVTGMDKIREQNKERQARFKAKQKQNLLPAPEEKTPSNVISNVTETLPVTLDNGTDIDKELDIDIKEKINKKEKPTASRFVRPSLEEVRDYCTERKNNVDPEQFIAFYESNGWKVGKNPMKSWKSAIITWEKREREEHKHVETEHERTLRLLREATE